MRPSPHQDHDEDEYLGQNRHAFEEEEWEIYGTGDVRGGRRLTGDAFSSGGRELTNTQTSPDHNQAETERDADDPAVYDGHPSSPQPG